MLLVPAKLTTANALLSDNGLPVLTLREVELPEAVFESAETYGELVDIPENSTKHVCPKELLDEPLLEATTLGVSEPPAVIL